MMDWSALNPDVLRIIAQEKMDFEDYIRCQSVCKNWKSAIQSSPMSLRRPQLPWLMLPYCLQHNHARNTSGTSCRCFYSFSDKKTHHIQFPSGHYDKFCIGSSHSWLVIMEETSPLLFLLNPLTKQRIELPPIPSFPDILHFRPEDIGREYLVAYDGDELEFSMKEMTEFYLSKVILSSDPTLHGCIAVAIFGDSFRLAYCRVDEDHKWTEVHHDFEYQDDVIFWKGAFYAAGQTGSLLVFDPNSNFSSPKVDVIINRDTKNDISGDDSARYYLVADSVLDELLLICKASKIHVHSLNEEKKLWEKKQCLGGKLLFLGYNHTLCFSAADYPRLKPNSIYFTDDHREGYVKGKFGGHNICIFDMDEGILSQIPCYDTRPCSIWPPPIWVTPSLTATTLTSST